MHHYGGLDCDFSTGVCPWCKTEAPPHVRRNCPKRKGDYADCIHRGDEVRRVVCPTCRGRVAVKVYACTVWAECSLETDVGVKVCLGCLDVVSR